jgi:hypothetical protein
MHGWQVISFAHNPAVIDSREITLFLCERRGEVR